MKTIQQIFQTLAGTWTLHRTISGAGHVDGIACFKAVAMNGLHYQEAGVFTALAKGNKYQIEREYFYGYDTANNKISVHFAQAEQATDLLHDLHFIPASLETIPLATALHHCRYDKYEAQYSFFNDDQFKLIYSVKGPAKNYTVETLFNRKL